MIVVFIVYILLTSSISRSLEFNLVSASDNLCFIL